MKIILGADPFAYGLKKSLATHLVARGIEVEDADNYKEIPYYEVAETAAKAVAADPSVKSVLLCGTGAGMCIVANKIEGIRAVDVESVFAAKKAKAINDANVLTMGAMIVGEFMANEIVDAWLDTNFTEGLEQFADFLKMARDKVGAIDKRNR